jgi:hypothetical protein
MPCGTGCDQGVVARGLEESESLGDLVAEAAGCSIDSTGNVTAQVACLRQASAHTLAQAFM